MSRVFTIIVLIVIQFNGCSTGNYKLIITDEYAYYAKDSIAFIADTTASYEMKNATFLSGTELTDSSFMMRVDPPVAIYKEPPPYSDDLKETFEGEIDIKVWVSSTGKILHAYLINSTNLSLNKLTLEASLKWKFKPASYNGKPLGVWVKIPFRFQ